jgi:Xaa-Pro aminopeptidase
MRYAPIDSKLFRQNREKFVKQMKPNSVAFFFSNDLMPKSADAFHNFVQNPDIFWLTGVDQEESVLILFPDAPNPEWKEVLLLRETNDTIKLWEGAKLSRDEGREVSGIQNVFWNNRFENLLWVTMEQAENCYLHLNEHDRYVSNADYGDARHVREIMRKFPLHHYERSAPITHILRSVKSEIEIELIKHAVSVTKKGLERILKFIKPGVWEYEIEAELWHTFISNRSRGHAYEPIIASGANSNVLHYVSNDQQVKDGDLILLDFGAEYANYASDLTRTIPANGRYTKRQKEVYNAVLRVMQEAKKMLKPGNTLPEYQEATGKLVEKELVNLGLISMSDIRDQDPAWPAYKKYFAHGTSHFLGLNVHDVGNRYLPMRENMVFTCEPGIYIPEEGFGIRIENNIVIRRDKNIDLMEGFPTEAEEIEETMNAGK